MTIASRPQYGQPIARVTRDGLVVALEDFEKFLDDLINVANQGEEASQFPPRSMVEPAQGNASPSSPAVSLPIIDESQRQPLHIPLPAEPCGVVGSIIPYRFSGSVPNYLELDGSTYNVDDFPALGALYGGVPGGTFAVDDWRDVPLWGAGGTAVGTLTGSDTVNLAHDHTVNPPNTTTGAPSATTQVDGTGTAVASDNHTHDVDIPEFTSGSALGSTDIRPRRAYVRWLIRAKP